MSSCGILPLSARFTACLPRIEPISRIKACGVKLALHNASTSRNAGGMFVDDAIRDRCGDVGCGRKPTGDARMSFFRFSVLFF